MNGPGEYTLQDAGQLNTLKNRIRAITLYVDTLQKTYPDNSLEARQVKHETRVLLEELQVHGLLHEDVFLDQRTGALTDTYE